MSLSLKQDGDNPPKGKGGGGSGKKRAPSGEIGSALRSVYDRALAEDIPPEMLDLLGKLG